jgi:ribonucleotide reductase alpha subunit
MNSEHGLKPTEPSLKDRQMSIAIGFISAVQSHTEQLPPQEQLEFLRLLQLGLNRFLQSRINDVTYVDGTKWKYEYVVDATADRLIKDFGLKPDQIDTAYHLSNDYERRIAFQADVQDYVDMSISSTINLPAWGSRGNDETRVQHFAETLAKYAPRLRGFTCYPDGSRGGQPITECEYQTAVENKGVVYEEHDVCDITGHGGSCGV